MFLETSRETGECDLLNPNKDSTNPWNPPKDSLNPSKSFYGFILNTQMDSNAEPLILDNQTL